MTWQYNTSLHSDAFIASLADKYQLELNDLIKHCLLVNETANTTTAVNHVGAKAINSNEQLQLIRPASGNSAEAAPVFCLHHRGGHTLEYRATVKSLSPEIPVYGIQSRVLSEPDYNEYEISVVAEQYADLIQSVQAGGPYRLLGWSLGGVLATAIAEVLEARGQSVSFLGLIDAALADTDTVNAYIEEKPLLDRLLDVFGVIATQRYQALDLDIQSQFERALNHLNESSSELKAVNFACDWIIKTGLIDSDVIDADYLRLRYLTTVQSRRLIRSYTPCKVIASTHIWWAQDSLVKGQAPTQWQNYCSNSTQHKPIEGGHFDICLLYTSPSPRDLSTSRMPSSA